MGELIDKVKGNVNEAVGKAKQQPHHQVADDVVFGLRARESGVERFRLCAIAAIEGCGAGGKREDKQQAGKKQPPHHSTRVRAFRHRQLSPSGHDENCSDWAASSSHKAAAGPVSPRKRSG